MACEILGGVLNAKAWNLEKEDNIFLKLKILIEPVLKMLGVLGHSKWGEM